MDGIFDFFRLDKIELIGFFIGYLILFFIFVFSWLYGLYKKKRGSFSLDLDTKSSKLKGGFIKIYDINDDLKGKIRYLFKKKVLLYRVIIHYVITDNMTGSSKSANVLLNHYEYYDVNKHFDAKDLYKLDFKMKSKKMKMLIKDEYGSFSFITKNSIHKRKKNYMTINITFDIDGLDLHFVEYLYLKKNKYMGYLEELKKSKK